MGNLTSVLWTDPDGDEVLLKAHLRRQFGGNCLGTLLGQQQSFGYQAFHDVFLQVTELCFAENGTLLSLLQKSDEVCNIIIG